jgi:hypothetical protein
MQAKKIIPVIAVAGAAVLATAPMAAAGNGSVSVVPGSAQPGATVTVYDGNLCRGDSATATSDAFSGDVQMSSLANMLGGDAKIANVSPGSYKVYVKCGNSERRWKSKTYCGSVTVLAPAGPVKTGLGGAVRRANPAEIAGGAALLALAAGGAGAFVIRRRRTGDAA